MEVKILIGVPGVGKSTYIQQVKTDDDLVLASDSIRVELFGTLGKQSKEDHRIVFDTLHNRLLEAVKQGNYQTVFYDSTGLNRKDRRIIYNSIKQININTTVTATCLLKPLKEIIKQNKQRTGEQRVPEQGIKGLVGKYRSLMVPRIGVDCDAIEKPYGMNFKDFQEEFNYDLEHDSTYHQETVLEHVQMVVENAKKTGDPNLVEVAQFHDLGKHICKQFQENRPTASFKGHNNVSAMYYLASLDLEDPNIGQKLRNMEAIFQHMNAHNGLTDKVVRLNNLEPELIQQINEFAKIDSVSKIEWPNHEFVVPEGRTTQHFNPNKGVWEPCRATKRKCPFYRSTYAPIFRK